MVEEEFRISQSVPWETTSRRFIGKRVRTTLSSPEDVVRGNPNVIVLLTRRIEVRERGTVRR